MSSSVANLILVLGLIGIGYYVWTGFGGTPLDLGGLFGFGGGGGGGSGITAAAGKMIYRGTGKVLSGSLAVKDANKSYSMSSGHDRPSTRYIWGSGKGKGDAKCVNFNSYEATVYAKFGSGGMSNTRAIITGGGPGQRDKNCCVYSLGFVTATGAAYAEEEGPHSPKPTIYKMNVQGGSVGNIGKLDGRTIGLKQVLIRNSGKVLLEGWVDEQANGNWKLFYRATNPKGGSLPVITKNPMAGENCGEVRFRTDGNWPVDMDLSRSFIAELPDNAIPTTDKNTPPVTSADQTQAKPDKKTDTKSKSKSNSKSKKSNYAFEYDGQFHYLETQPISTLYSEY